MLTTEDYKTLNSTFKAFGRSCNATPDVLFVATRLSGSLSRQSSLLDRRRKKNAHNTKVGLPCAFPTKIEETGPPSSSTRHATGIAASYFARDFGIDNRLRAAQDRQCPRWMGKVTSVGKGADRGTLAATGSAPPTAPARTTPTRATRRPSAPETTTTLRITAVSATASCQATRSEVTPVRFAGSPCTAVATGTSSAAIRQRTLPGVCGCPLASGPAVAATAIATASGPASASARVASTAARCSSPSPTRVVFASPALVASA